MGRDLEGGGVAVVKLGADGKESALLVRKGAARWICLVGGLLVLGSCGAWVMYESRMERQAEVSRLTRLVRSTGERVQALRRVSDRLDDSKESNEVKEKLAKELKLTSDIHEAQEEHTRAQAAMMKKMMPSAEHEAAAREAAEKVPKDIQQAMLKEFRAKGQFLVWSTAKERDQAWRASPSFGKKPKSAIEDELDDIEDAWEDGELDTTTLVKWLKGNVTAGRYPPPVNLLSGIAGYLEDMTGGEEESLFIEYEERMKAFTNGAHKEAFEAAAATVQRVVALAADELSWIKDPTPTFQSVYAALVQYHMTEWFFPGDDPSLEEGEGAKFKNYQSISEAEEDDDDEENDMEYTEKDDDEAEE